MTQAATAPTSQEAVSAGHNTDNERSLAEIVSNLWEKTEALVRQEMRLGIAEAEEKASKLLSEADQRLHALKTEAEGTVATLKVELIAKALAGSVMLAGMLSLCAALILLLVHVVTPWLAAGIVGAVISGVGFILLNRPLRTDMPRLHSPKQTAHQDNPAVRR